MKFPKIKTTTILWILKDIAMHIHDSPMHFAILLCAFRILLYTFTILLCAFRILPCTFTILLCAFRILLCTFAILLCAFKILPCTFTILLCAFRILPCKLPFHSLNDLMLKIPNKSYIPYRILNFENKRNLSPQKKPRISSRLLPFGWMTGFEPATLGTTNRCSNQLSYNHHLLSGCKYRTNVCFCKEF